MGCNMKNLTNEELALTYQRTHDEEIFNEIYRRFDRLIKRFVSKNIAMGFLERDEILSSCHIGLYKAVTEFPDLEIANLSTRVYRRMQAEIAHKYTYFNTKNRRYLRENSISINKPIETDSGIIEFCELLDHKESKDAYFKNMCIDYEPMINYAMSKVNNEDVKPYIIPFLLGHYLLEEVAEITGITYQTVSYHIKKFKTYFERYINMKKIKLEAY